GHGAMEPDALGGDLLRAVLHDQLEADRRLEEVRAATPEAGRGRQAVQPALAAPPARRRFARLDLILELVQALQRRDGAAPVLPLLLLLAAQVLQEPRLHEDPGHQ